MLSEKRRVLEESKERYENGLIKLKETAEQVEEASAEKKAKKADPEQTAEDEQTAEEEAKKTAALFGLFSAR